MPLIKKAHMFIMLAEEKLFENTVEFYKKLDLQPKFHLKEKWAEFDLGNLLVGICPASQELPDRRTGIVFEVEDLKKTYDESKEYMTFLSEPVEAIHGIMASVKDPAGNIFDLYQPTPDKVKDLAKKIKEKEETCQESCEESCSDKTCCDDAGCSTEEECDDCCGPKDRC